MTELLKDRLSYRAELPLACEPLAQPLSAQRRRELLDQNLRVLAVVAALEERPRMVPSGEGSDPFQQELERMHQKLDLMMLLLGQFLRRQGSVAPTVALVLGSEGLCWTGAPQVDGPVLLSVWLHPCLGEPLQWPATVAAEGGDEHCARFEPLGELLESALERHVFLHHRRSVAERRQPGGA